MGAGPSLRSPRRRGLDRPGPTRLAGIFAPPWPHATSTAMAARSSGSGDRGAARSAWSRGGVLSFSFVSRSIHHERLRLARQLPGDLLPQVTESGSQSASLSLPPARLGARSHHRNLAAGQ